MNKCVAGALERDTNRQRGNRASRAKPKLTQQQQAGVLLPATQLDISQPQTIGLCW